MRAGRFCNSLSTFDALRAGRLSRLRGRSYRGALQVDIATVATMARSLGDEELAVLIEGGYDEVFSTIREATDDIDDLIEIFSQT